MEEETKSTLQTGYGRADYTPDEPVPIGGFGNAQNRIGGNIITPIGTICVAAKDSKGTVALFYTLDLCGIDDDHTHRLAKKLNEKFGIPEDNIFFSCTHSHSAPAGYLMDNIPSYVRWQNEFFYPAIMKAGEEALNDLADTEIYGAKTKLENSTFVRRYLDEDENFYGFYDKGEPTHHETEADNDLQVIKLARKDKKSIVLVNWQTHPCFHGGETWLKISGDYPYYLRKAIEDYYGGLPVFYQGAAGNLTARGRFEGEEMSGVFVYEKWCEYYGLKIAVSALSALQKVKKLESGDILIGKRMVKLTVNHSQDHLKDKAAEVWKLYSDGNKEEALALAKEYGIKGVYAARDITFKARLARSRSIPVWAVKIGDLGLGFAPYEMFDTNGMQIKEISKSKITFICELTNEGHSYMPSRIAFRHGGYEVNSCKYIPGTAELLAENIANLLNNL